MSSNVKTTEAPGTIEIGGVTYTIADALAMQARMAEQLGPRILSPQAQKEAAHAAVAAMKLTPAQIETLRTHYITVGWKFLGRAMLGKSLEECIGAK